MSTLQQNYVSHINLTSSNLESGLYDFEFDFCLVTMVSASGIDRSVDSYCTDVAVKPTAEVFSMASDRVK